MLYNKTSFLGKNSRYLTKGIFLETCEDTSTAVYTLKESNQELPNGTILPSLYLFYLEEEDITEGIFANKYLGGVDHWQELVKAPFFKPYITKWRKDLEQKIRGEAFRRILGESRDAKSKNSFQANKFIFEKASQALDKQLLTKEEVIYDTVKEPTDKGREAEDYVRMLKLVK